MVILWWWGCSLLYFLGFWTQFRTRGNEMVAAINNLFCSAYYICKIVSHQYLGHKSYRKIKKILNHAEGALFVMIMTLILWRFPQFYWLDDGNLGFKRQVREWTDGHL